MCFLCSIYASAENVIIKTYPKITGVVTPEKGICFAHGDTLELKFEIKDCSVLPQKISVGASSQYEKNGSSWSGSGGIVFVLNEQTHLYELDRCYDTFTNAQLTYTDEYVFVMAADFTTEQNIQKAGYHSISIYHDEWAEKEISANINCKYVVNDNCAMGKHTISNDYEITIPGTYACVICGNTVTIISPESVIIKTFPKITNIITPEYGTCFSQGDTIGLNFEIRDCSVLPQKISIGASSQYEKNGSSFSGSGGIVFILNENTRCYELDYSYNSFTNAQLTYTDEYMFVMTADLTATQNIRKAGFHSISIYHDDWNEKNISVNINDNYVVNDNCAIGKHTITDDDEFVTITPANCQEEGKKSFYCVICSNIVKTEIIPVKEHSYGDWYQTQVPTCTVTGIDEHECSVCHNKETRTTDANGHTNAEAVVENKVDSTCTVDGSYDSVVYCSACTAEVSREAKTIDKLGHDHETEWTVDLAPTCTEKGSMSHHCTRCDSKTDVTELSANGHSSSDAVIENSVDPTCTDDGIYDEVIYCEICNEELSRIVRIEVSLGHNSVIDVGIAPTCTESGLTEGSHCNRCDEILVVQEVIPALGHSWLDATTESPKTCETCGETEGDSLPKPTPDPDPEPNPNPEKDHDECKEEASGWKKFWRAIGNFFRMIVGLPKKCVCGDVL